MNLKKELKIITILTLLLTITFTFCAPVYSNTTLREQQKKETRRKINHLKLLENLETNKLYKNQQKLETTSTNLHQTKKTYHTTQQQLSTLESQLAGSLSEFAALDYQLKRRIRLVFKTQRKGFFELLLTATDINTFFDRLYFEGLIIKGDYDKMVKIRKKAKEIALLKYNIEEQKKYIARSIKSINQQQATIQRAIARNENMIHRLRTNRIAYEKAERELAQQSSSIQTMINRTSHGTDIQVASGFIKPISGRITSPFGWRTHPIFNSRTFHSGVDIGGAYHGAIRASNSGKVIYSGWYGGYGKVVIVDHGTIGGKPITTLYAHMDVIKVSVGQYVSKGQVVGLEGTTGYSTGPHLHFEVRVNGKPNNPLGYI